MNKKIYKVAVALNNGIEGIKFVKVEAYDEAHLTHILKTKNLEYRFIDSVTEKRKYCVKTYRFEKGVRIEERHDIYEEYKDAKLFFNKYALENKYVMLWFCENDGTDICEYEVITLDAPDGEIRTVDSTCNLEEALKWYNEEINGYVYIQFVDHESMLVAVLKCNF